MQTLEQTSFLLDATAGSRLATRSTGNTNVSVGRTWPRSSASRRARCASIEKQGLALASCAGNGMRFYGNSDRERVALILKLSRSSVSRWSTIKRHDPARRRHRRAEQTREAQSRKVQRADRCRSNGSSRRSQEAHGRVAPVSRRSCRNEASAATGSPVRALRRRAASARRRPIMSAHTPERKRGRRRSTASSATVARRVQARRAVTCPCSPARRSGWCRSWRDRCSPWRSPAPTG